MASKAKKSKLFDAAEYLDGDKDIAEYISEALLTRDVDVITRTIGAAAKARA
jgi:DNA-binding phage protein